MSMCCPCLEEKSSFVMLRKKILIDKVLAECTEYLFIPMHRKQKTREILLLCQV